MALVPYAGKESEEDHRSYVARALKPDTKRALEILAEEDLLDEEPEPPKLSFLRPVGHPDYVYRPWSNERRMEASCREWLRAQGIVVPKADPKAEVRANRARIQVLLYGRTL